MVVINVERWIAMHSRWSRTLAELYSGEPKEPDAFASVVNPMSEEAFGALGLAEQVLVVEVVQRFPTLSEAQLLDMLQTV